MPPFPHAIVFDLDGTLIDSTADIAAALNHALVSEHLTAIALASVRPMIGHGVRALIARAQEYHLLPPDPARAQRLYAAFHAHARANPIARTEIFSGMAEILHHLRARGLKLGICTNKTTALAQMIVAALPLAPLIDWVTGGDGPYPSKPDPAGLLATIAALGSIPEHAIYIGDMQVDFQTAQAANIKFIGIDHGHWPHHDPALAGVTPVKGAPGLKKFLQTWSGESADVGF